MLELVVFWLSILALVVFLYAISGLAAAIFAPYLVWVTFAGWLNFRVVQLNSPFSGRSRD
jgi:benzodiazapine receptor